jgi:hypothetical protein
MTGTPPPAPPPRTSARPPLRRRRGRGLPTAALILGLFAFIPLLGSALGIAAVVLGAVCLSQRRPDKGRAVVGMILGGALGVLLPLALAPPLLGYYRAKEEAERIDCAAQLAGIVAVVGFYQAEHDGEPPPDLQTLAEEPFAERDWFRCPCATAGRQVDYFYHPPAPDAPPTALVVCDLEGNHDDGRNAAQLDGNVQWLTEQEFQQLLAEPENAEFARALKQAEGP